MPTTSSHENLSLQENTLAAAMLHNLGDATVRFTLGQDGIRRHELAELSPDDFDNLVTKFRHDPKDSLAFARESLHAINRDDRLTADQKEGRLDRYLDAYFDLTIKLDRQAFPKTKEGKVERGVPEYVPDGFVDMGGDGDLDPTKRSREQIVVDKHQILERYKPVLKDLFSRDFSSVDLQAKKRQIATKLLLEVYRLMPYDHGFDKGSADYPDGKANLSEMDEGVCRHRALVFQVLSQAVGLKTQLLKVNWDGVRHAANTMRVDGQWYIADVNNPDYVPLPGGKREWRPGVYKIDSPPKPRSVTHYDVVGKNSGEHHEYDAHDNMFWYIQ